MESRAKIFGHAVHPILIVFPLGLFATAVVFDAIGWATGNGTWLEASFRIIAAGVIGGMIAALFGLLDFQAIPWNTRAKRIGIWHGLINVGVILLFGASWLTRWTSPSNPGRLPVMLSLAGALLMLMAGWLGGELVERLGVGVDDGANLNAPNSLTGRPARESRAHDESQWDRV
ncbi:MAG TPA: DUF2231 domain-containing protein [Blastocatellia bacterium]|nr:DUF2231 domain-containing protein [Blastocatellia bacterium]